MSEEDLKVIERVIATKPKLEVEITKDKPFQFLYVCDTYNLKNMELYFNANGKENNIAKIEIIYPQDNITLEEVKIKLKDGWNVIEFDNLIGVYQEELTIKISSVKGEFSIYKDIFKNVLMKVSYTEINEELEQDLDTKTKELRKIYSSSGWKFLISIYKVRDFVKNLIIKPLRLLKKVLSKIGSVIKHVNRNNISRALDYIKKHGMEAFIRNTIRKMRGNKVDYQNWLKENPVLDVELEQQRVHKFDYEPKISILIPTYKTPKGFLIATLDSVLGQTYSNWELCIADGNSETPHVNEILDRYRARDKRIKVRYLDENKGIGGNTQECWHLATGDYVGLFDHDDLLHPNALYEIVKAVNEDPEIEFIYTDEDKISEDGDFRFDPNFKPDFAMDTLRSYNYICHFSVFRKDLMEKIGGFREGFDGSQDYDLILRATEVAKNVHHIPKILYSWRVHSGSTASNPKSKMYCYTSAKKALDESLARCGLKGKAVDGKYLGHYDIEYDIIGNPKVSILIPSKDHIEDLDRTIKSVINKTTYDNYEIIVIENNSEINDTFEYYKDLEETYSNIKVITWESEFNYSAINNFGARHATGEYLLLLNNDVEVITGNWLSKMLQLAQREDVGCVGAKLYYPDNTIQHGGVIIGLGGVAGHSHKYFHKKDYGYSSRLIVTQNLSAVTAACLLVKKEVFDAVNGLDEKFAVAFNDVDFCLRVLELGKANLWTPYAELYHHESKSRGYEDTKEKQERFKGEIDRFFMKHGEFLRKGDPYYNPNLTLDHEDFSYRKKEKDN